MTSSSGMSSHRTVPAPHRGDLLAEPRLRENDGGVFAVTLIPCLFLLTERKYAASLPRGGGPTGGCGHRPGVPGLDHASTEIPGDRRRVGAGQCPCQAEDPEPAQSAPRAMLTRRRLPR